MKKGGKFVLTLKKLKNVGCVSVDYELVDYHSTKTVFLSEIESWSESKKSNFTGVVLCDNCLWAATLKRIPIVKANKVYSSDGESLIVWDAKKRIVFIKELQNSMLNTIKQIIVPFKNNNKEDHFMAGTDLGNLDLTGLEDMNAFGDTAQAQPTTGIADATSKESEQSKLNREFIEKMKQQDIDVSDNVSLITQNQRLGRCLGFICKTDAVVRMALAKIAAKDAQGNVIPNEKATEADKQMIADYNSGKEGAKKPPLRILKTNNEFRFRQSKPGKIVGMIIAIPTKTLGIDYATVLNGSGKLDETAGDALTVRVFPIEQAYDYLINAFDGRIMEDESLMGARAAWLRVNGVVARKKPGAVSVAGGQDNIRFNLKLEGRTETRKTLLTATNYIPCKLFVTASQNQITSSEVAQSLNNNVANLLKDDSKRGDLTEASKNLLDGDNAVKYFSQSSANRPSIEAPDAFDGSGKVKDVQIATRTRKESTSKGTVSYPFVYNTEIADIVKRPSVAAILNRAGLSQEELAKHIKNLNKSTSAGSSTSSRRISSLDLDTLKKYSRTRDSRSIKELAATLAGI